MHIADGILPVSVTVGSLIATGGITTVLAVRMKQQRIPKIAVITAVIFVSSLIHIKLGPTSIHPVLLGIGVVILGPDVFLSYLVALFFQSIMFQHGGLTALGANTIVMGGGALLTSFWVRPLVLHCKNTIVRGILFFLAGFCALLLSGIGNYLLLYFSYDEFTSIARIFLISIIPLALLEGVLSLLMLQFIFRIKPSIIIQ